MNFTLEIAPKECIFNICSAPPMCHQSNKAGEFG